MFHDSQPPNTDDCDVKTHQASVYRGLLWVLGALGFALSVYASVPYLAKKVPWRFEQSAVESMQLFSSHQECKGSSDKNSIFQEVLRRIYPIYPHDKEFSIEAKIIHGKQVNAFAFLGGKIFVYDGLLQQADSVDELAAVLAHEIEHVRRRHVTQGLIYRILTYSILHITLSGGDLGTMQRLLNAAAQLSFSRSQEEEADRGALERLRDAQVSALGFKNFFGKNLGNSSLATLLSDHPSNQSRSQLADAFLGLPSQPILKDGEWDSIKKSCLTR